MGVAKYLSLAYNTLGMLPFALFSADMVKDLYPDMKAEYCPRRGPCTETLDFTVTKIYLQVIVGVAFMYSALVVWPGKKGLLGAMACMVATMTKHIVVDGLIPPPPVMVMTAGVILAVQFAPGEWGKRVFVGYCLLNAATFKFMPLTPLQDTFPEITEGSVAYKNGAHLFEVIGLYMLMAAIMAASSSKVLGLACSSHIGLCLIAKHVLVDKAGPPPPMIALWTATVAAAWYETGWTNFKPACEKAIKDGPMKLHSILLLTGFLPYMAAETVGLSFPVLGMSALDSSYTYSGSSAFLFGMLTVWLGLGAYQEYKGIMEGKLFTAYHYALSAIVYFWAVQPTTSTMGVAFFAAPHLFTAWCVYLVITKDAKRA
jgi:hypothetical protein